MKVFTAIFILLTNLSHAQKTSYQKLDSISTLISKVQKETESLSYKDEKGDTYQLSFPDDNFTIWANNKLASKAVYKKWGDREVLALTENIDLSKATGVDNGTSTNGVNVIKLIFPTGHLKTQLIENGIVTKTVTEDYLEFFCHDNPFKNYSFLKYIGWTCQLIQNEKGLLSVEDRVAINKDFDNWVINENKNELTVHTQLLNKYNSKNIPFIYRPVINSFYLIEKKDYEKVRLYIDSICKANNFYIGITEEEFNKLNPFTQNAKYYSRKNESDALYETQGYLYPIDKRYFSYYSLASEKSSKNIVGLEKKISMTGFRKKMRSVVKKDYEDFKNDIIKNIPNDFRKITTSYDANKFGSIYTYIVVFHPSLDYTLVLEYTQDQKTGYPESVTVHMGKGSRILTKITEFNKVFKQYKFLGHYLKDFSK